MQQHQIAIQHRANSLPIAYQYSVNPCQSFVNMGPFQGQYSPSTTIFQSANLGQAMPIRQSSANPCQSVPIRCQSANPRPIGQSQANPPIRCQSYVITEAIPALNQGTSPLCGLVSSPLGGRIQDNRLFPILTNPLKCWPIHANPGQSGANPWLIRDQLRS